MMVNCNPELSAWTVALAARRMIAAHEGISIDQAFARLRQHARQHNALLHGVARAVVEPGLSV